MTSAVLIHIQIETIGVLDHSSSLFFLWVVSNDYFMFKVSSLLLVLKKKASAMCVTDVTSMRSCMSYRKLLNYKNVLEH